MLANINNIVNGKLIVYDNTPPVGKVTPPVGKVTAALLVMLLLNRKHWPSVLRLNSPSDDSTVTSLLQAWIASPPERALLSEKEAPVIVNTLLVVEIAPPPVTAEFCLNVLTGVKSRPDIETEISLLQNAPPLPTLAELFAKELAKTFTFKPFRVWMFGFMSSDFKSTAPH